MAIIGKLIQRTTAISYRLNAKKGVEYKYQLEVLRKLMEQAKNTKETKTDNRPSGLHTLPIKDASVRSVARIG